MEQSPRQSINSSSIYWPFKFHYTTYNKIFLAIKKIKLEIDNKVIYGENQIFEI